MVYVPIRGSSPLYYSPEEIARAIWDEKECRDKKRAEIELVKKLREEDERKTRQAYEEILAGGIQSAIEDSKKSLQEKYDEAVKDGDLMYEMVILEAAERKGFKL